MLRFVHAEAPSRAGDGDPGVGQVGFLGIALVGAEILVEYPSALEVDPIDRGGATALVDEPHFCCDVAVQ